MQVVIHAGAHITDEDRLITCLAANRDRLAEQGTNIPAPTRYRKLIRDLMQSAESAPLSGETREVVLDAILQGEASDRLVLSSEGFFGTPKMAISPGVLYAATEARMATLREIFKGDQIELFVAICNPATFLPAMFQKTKFGDFDAFMRGSDPRALRWSEMIGRVRDAFPDLPITLWCNEDLPLIWAQVVREMAGLDPVAPIEGEFALLEEIMTPEGMTRFSAYLDQRPGMSEVQKRRVIAAFLDKFAQDEAIEEELDLPGWNEALIDELTEIYDEDLFAIRAIASINVITP